MTTTKERYNQCTNINCGHTFITHETFTRSICVPRQVDPAPPPPRPERSGNATVWIVCPKNHKQL
nr:ogr/Delta-like zinc finger family protein [Candidatus Sodalis sp. SoCistrobi]